MTIKECPLCHGKGTAIAVDGLTIDANGKIINRKNPRISICLCGGLGYIILESTTE